MGRPSLRLKREQNLPRCKLAGAVGPYLQAPQQGFVEPEEVAEVVAGRLLTLQVDEGLPIYVFPIRPLTRVMAMVASLLIVWAAM